MLQNEDSSLQNVIKKIRNECLFTHHHRAKLFSLCDSLYNNVSDQVYRDFYSHIIDYISIAYGNVRYQRVFNSLREAFEYIEIYKQKNAPENILRKIENELKFDSAAMLMNDDADEKEHANLILEFLIDDLQQRYSQIVADYHKIKSNA